KWAVPSVRTVVRVTDLCSYPAPFASWFSVHGAAAILVSNWQADQFVQARERIVINPILDPTPETERVPGRFVYASAPAKGLTETIAMWQRLHAEWPKEMAGTQLVIATPGGFDFYGDALPAFDDETIRYAGTPNVVEYRKLIASAEGLFYVNVQTEAFCNVAALAERSGTRPHILCRNGIGGIREAMASSATESRVTELESRFVTDFLDSFGEPPRFPKTLVDRSRSALAPRWEEAMHL
ncbi:MAG: hypothetical protein ACHQ50_17085, partial [Fimbriimonadales bacterium]